MKVPRLKKDQKVYIPQKFERLGLASLSVSHWWGIRAQVFSMHHGLDVIVCRCPKIFLYILFIFSR